MSGLIINCSSDHLPVVVLHDCDCGKDKEEHKIKYRGLRTEDSINASRAELQAQNWGESKSLIFSSLRKYFSPVIPPVIDQDDPIHRPRIAHTDRGMQRSPSSSVNISLNRAQSTTTAQTLLKTDATNTTI